MNYYEINDETIAIIPIDCVKTKIVEVNREYIVEKKAYNIMDESCQYYGSTYKGRLNAAKKILDCSYKLPILIEETSNIVFFPTKSSLEDDCCWINFNYIKSVIKSDNKSLITFTNNKKIEFDTSKLSIENQIARSTRLSYILNSRQNSIKNH